MSTLDQYINIVKNKLGISQEEIAKELNLTKDYLSKAKNKNSKSLYDKIQGKFGFLKPGDLGYIEAVNELKNVSDTVSQITGFSIEEISSRIYKRKDAIDSSLNGDWVSFGMSNVIRKAFPKVFESESIKYSTDEITRNQIINILKVKNKLSDQSNADYQLLKITEGIKQYSNCTSAVRVNNRDMEPLISQGAIIGLVLLDNTKTIINGRIYATLLKNGQQIISYLKQNQDLIEFYYPDQTKIKTELKISDIKEISEVIFTINPL